MYLLCEQRLKFVLSLQNLCSNTIIKDVTGKEMLAVDVFGLVIGYLREHLLTKLQSHDTKATLAEDTIQYILTVPAIWSDKAKAFMRLAAEKVQAKLRILGRKITYYRKHMVKS